MDRVSRCSQGGRRFHLVTTKVHSLFLLMLSCWLLWARTFSTQWGALQLNVKQLTRDSAILIPRQWVSTGKRWLPPPPPRSGESPWLKWRSLRTLRSGSCVREGRSMRLTAAAQSLYRSVVVKSKNSRFPGESTLLSNPYVSESIYYIYLHFPRNRPWDNSANKSRI